MIPYCKTALQSICPCSEFKQVDNNGIIETCQNNDNLKCQNMLDFENMTPFEWLALAYSVTTFQQSIILKEYDKRKEYRKCEEIKQKMADELGIDKGLLISKMYH